MKRGVEILLFLILFAANVYFFPRWADWGQNSRLDLTLAIVDQGSFEIGDYYHNTGDYAKFEGRYYSDKAPGPSFLGVPVYAAARPLLQSGPVQGIITRLASSDAFGSTLNEEGTGLQQEKIYQALVLMIVTMVVVALPSAFLGVLLYRLLNQINEARGWNVAAVLVWGLATPAFPYSGTFISHQLVAFLLFAAFWLGFQMRQGRLSPAWAGLVGFLLGYAVISEYPSAVIAGGIALYVLLTMPDKRWLAAAVVGGLLPVAGMMAYNYSIFRTVLPVGYEYSELYSEQHSQGFLSLTYPHFEALWGITFGSFRGLFFLAPVLLLAVAGFVPWWRTKRLRPELYVCAWAVISYLLYNGSSIMWQGGFAIGPRYVVPMLPFLAAGFGGFAARWGRALWARLLMGILTAWSVFAVWAETLGGQSFPDWTPNPLFNYSLPHLAQGNIARNMGMVLNLSGWSSVLLLVVVLAIGIFLIARILRSGPRKEIGAAQKEPA